jgi:protein-disulfide isomerase
MAHLPVAASFTAVLLLSLGACAKNSADVPSANAAPAPKPAPAPAAEDTTSAPPGIDLSKLDDFERKVFFRVLGNESSACGKAHSLLHSVRNDRGCRRSFYAAKYVARLVDAGYTDSEIAESITKRFRAGAPRKVEIGDAPVKGNPNAPVTVVEFVDYECPHCKRIQAVLRQLVEEYPGEVKVYFKHYPLGSHTNARTAAEAAAAAHKQGKFWAYNDKVWAQSDSLTPAALEQFAKEVGLDVAQWRKDFESAAIKERVTKDKAEGGALGLTATPTVYINGRLFTDQRDIESLRDWVDEELGR